MIEKGLRATVFRLKPHADAAQFSLSADMKVHLCSIGARFSIFHPWRKPPFPDCFQGIARKPRRSQVGRDCMYSILRIKIRSTPSARGSRSAYPCPKYKIEMRSLREGAEVPVPRDKRNALVDTGLGNQRISETRFATFCKHSSPQRSRPLPITRCDLDQRYFRNYFNNTGRKIRVTQQFCKYNGHHDYVPIFQGAIEQLYILSTVPCKKGDPTTRVGRDHRSSFSSATVREKRTLPRSLRRRA